MSKSEEFIDSLKSISNSLINEVLGQSLKQTHFSSESIPELNELFQNIIGDLISKIEEQPKMDLTYIKGLLVKAFESCANSSTYTLIQTKCIKCEDECTGCVSMHFINSKKEENYYNICKECRDKLFIKKGKLQDPAKAIIKNDYKVFGFEYYAEYLYPELYRQGKKK